MLGADRRVVRNIALDDLELHVSVLSVPGHEDYVELRWFIPNLDRYGRGITFPRSELGDVLEGLSEIHSLPDAT
jgi:hypothetical protein